MKTHLAMYTLSLAGLTLLLACEHADQSGAMTTETGPRMGSTNAQAANIDSNVVESLSAARCRRAQTCNAVGPGQKYVTLQVCMEQMRGSIANDLNGYNCPRGIDGAQVSRCEAAVAAEDCGNPVDTLSRMEKCRTDPMCLK
jgi:hypothetical protein